MAQISKAFGDKLSLTADEEEPMIFADDETLDTRSSVSLNNLVVCKVLTAKPINLHGFHRAMQVVWKAYGTIISKALNADKNIFCVTFRDASDVVKVLEGRPWSYDRALIVMEKFDGNLSVAEYRFDSCPFWIQLSDLPLKLMTEEAAIRFGNKVGKYLCVDGEMWLDCLGQTLRIRVEIDLAKPIRRGIMILFNGKERWIPVQYERLPLFCFWCGRIGHRVMECAARTEEDPEHSISTYQYSDDLRAGDGRGGGRSRNGGEQMNVSKQQKARTDEGQFYIGRWFRTGKEQMWEEGW